MYAHKRERAYFLDESKTLLKGSESGLEGGDKGGVSSLGARGGAIRLDREPYWSPGAELFMKESKQKERVSWLGLLWMLSPMPYTLHLESCAPQLVFTVLSAHWIVRAAITLRGHPPGIEGSALV